MRIIVSKNGFDQPLIFIDETLPNENRPSGQEIMQRAAAVLMEAAEVCARKGLGFPLNQPKMLPPAEDYIIADLIDLGGEV